jgi:hypothetical protein
VNATQTELASSSDLSAQQTATAAALLTQAAPTQDQGGGDTSALNLTATAIAGNFLTLTAQAGPTQETIATQPAGGFGTAIPRPTALPDTGLFDEVAGGGRDGVTMLALAVIGLVGVIFIARRMRNNGNTKQ